MDYPPKIEVVIKSVPVSPDCGPLWLHVKGLNISPSFKILPGIATCLVASIHSLLTFYS